MFPYSQIENRSPQHNVNLDDLIPKDLLEDEPLENQLLRHSEAGDELIIESLLAQGVDPNVRNERGETPLHKAALKGHLVIMSMLLKARAHKYAMTFDLKTPMAYAIQGGQFDAIRLLIEKFKYDINYQNPYYSNLQMPLEDVCQYCNSEKNFVKFIEIAKYLLRNGASVTLASNAMFTNVKLLKPPVLNVHKKYYSSSQEILVPNKKAINILILAGANRQELLSILDEKIKFYSKQEQMTWNIFSKFHEAKKMCCTMYL